MSPKPIRVDGGRDLRLVVSTWVVFLLAALGLMVLIFVDWPTWLVNNG